MQDIDDAENRIYRFVAFLQKNGSAIVELTTEVLRTFVDRIISVSPTEVVFCVAGIKNYSDNEFAEQRFEFIKKEPIATGSYYDDKVKKTMEYRVVLI